MICENLKKSAVTALIKQKTKQPSEALRLLFEGKLPKFLNE